MTDPRDGADDLALDEGRGRPAAAARVRFSRRVAVLIAAVVVLAVVVLGAGLALGAQGATAARSHQEVRVTPVASRAAASPSVLVAHDSGPRPFAAGTAAAKRAGVFRYTTVQGDTFLGIASRFHVCVADLEGGRPLAVQDQPLTVGAVITVELGTWPRKADGTVDCVWDH